MNLQAILSQITPENIWYCLKIGIMILGAAWILATSSLVLVLALKYSVGAFCSSIDYTHDRLTTLHLGHKIRERVASEIIKERLSDATIQRATKSQLEDKLEEIVTKRSA